MTQPDSSLKAASRRKLSFFQTLRAVAWSFFGVRKAVIGALVLVAVLATLVNWVLTSGVAA